MEQDQIKLAARAASSPAYGIICLGKSAKMMFVVQASMILTHIPARVLTRIGHAAQEEEAAGLRVADEVEIWMVRLKLNRRINLRRDALHGDTRRRRGFGA